MEIVDSLINLVSGLGTSRDKQSYSEFQRRNLTESYLGTLYRHWIFAKAIDIPVDDALSKWRKVWGPEDLDLEEFYTVENEFEIRESLNEAWKWARLYGGAGILIDVIDPAGSLEEPLEIEKLQQGCLQNLYVLDRNDITPIHEFGVGGTIIRKPIKYQLNDGSYVHPSRFIRFDGVKIPWRELQRNSYWGDSILERIYDEALAAKTTMSSIASLIFEANLDIISVKNLFSMVMTGAGRDKIIDRFRLASLTKSINKVTLLDADEETFDRKSANFSGLSPLIQEFLNAVAAAADIPITRFLSRSAAGLNATGEGDLSNYYDMIQAKQATEIGPRLRQLDEILLMHTYGFIPDEWGFEWCPLWALSETEQATANKTEAETDNILLSMDVIRRDHIAARVQQKGTYPTLDSQFVDELKDLEELLKYDPKEIQSGRAEPDGDQSILQDPEKRDSETGDERSVTQTETDN